MNEHLNTDERAQLRTRVLIVDDNHDAARMLKLLLKLEGYEVRIAHDGPDAIAAATANQPAVILMDLTLPGMSGLEAAEQLRQADGLADTVIVAVSGHAADRLPQPSPFDAHLTKPVDHDRLIRLLADATAHQAANPRPTPVSA
jgi:CheY-like chemotaxis protein